MLYSKLKLNTAGIEDSILSSLVPQSAPGMSHLPIFKVLNLRKENFNHLVLWYLSRTIPKTKFEKE